MNFGADSVGGLVSGLGTKLVGAVLWSLVPGVAALVVERPSTRKLGALSYRRWISALYLYVGLRFAEIDHPGPVNRQSRGLRMHSGEDDDVWDFLTWWWLWRCLALANLQDSGWLK